MTPEEIKALNTLMAEKGMGWHKEAITGAFGEDIGWHWIDAEGNHIADDSWSPATNPADCAHLKHKIRTSGFEYTIRAIWIGLGVPREQRDLLHLVHLYPVDGPCESHAESRESEELAMCLAVRAMLEAP